MAEVTGATEVTVITEVGVAEEDTEVSKQDLDMHKQLRSRSSACQIHHNSLFRFCILEIYVKAIRP